MRKTLTAIIVVLAAGSLAACDNLPWSKPKDPPATPVATGSETPPVDPTATATTPEAPKPADQTAAVDPSKPASPDKAPVQPAPATK